MKIQEVGVWIILGSLGVALVQSPWCFVAAVVGVFFTVTK